MKTFSQWLMEKAGEVGVVAGEARPSHRQIQATDQAKQQTADIVKNQPELATKLAAGGNAAKQAQVKVSADVASNISKNSGTDVDATKAAFSGVDSVIDDIENSIDSPKMMKKRMKKK